MSKDEPGETYGPASIELLTGIEAVRRRPGMYIGATDAWGLHNLLWEVVGNSIDEHLAGYARRIDITIDRSSVTVEDDGRGIPVELHPTLGKPALEVIFTELHAGPTHDGHWPHVHIAPQLHGVGLAPVNALCERLHVSVCRNGRRFEMEFARGEPVGPLRDCGPAEGRGTCITCWPDPAVFATTAFDVDLIEARLQELSYFNPGLTITIQGRSHHEPQGLVAMVQRMCAPQVDSNEPIVHLLGEASDVQVEVAMCWSEDHDTTVASFVSQRPTPQGGTHVDGLFVGLRQAFSAHLDVGDMAALPASLTRGLIASIHIGLYDPRFGGPTRACLASEEAYDGVREVVALTLAKWLDAHPPLVARLRQRLEP